MTEDWRHGGFGIYVHWPFCQSKCPYCDFNSHVVSNVDQDAWRAAFLSEIDRYARIVPDRLVNSVFFGGGTPSLMPGKTVEAILSRIQTHWPLANDVEITLEANPSSVEATRFEDFRSAGVNRVSLGVQALNDVDLKRLGRLHSVNEAKRAMEIAQTCFDRHSFDLIYARQDQSVTDWDKELQTALTFGFSHLSLYSLTIEPDTAFGALNTLGRLTGLPDEDLSADLYDLTVERCNTAGLAQYEVSNFAAFGEESRHNKIYWKSGDYIGIGPGAHGRITSNDGIRYATEAKKLPKDWLTADAGQTELPARALTSTEHSEEMLMMGLRLIEGLDLSRSAGSIVDSRGMAELRDLGLVHLENQILRADPKAFNILNQVISKLVCG